MIQFFVAVLIVFLAAIYPVMIAARMVDAKKTGPGAALFAVLLQGMVGALIQLTLIDPIISGVVAVLAGSMIYALILQTTILRGFVISIIAIAIGVAFLLLFVGLGGAFLALAT